MPIYEYQCESCKEVIERWQSLSDQPLTTCPSCSGAMKKLISMSSFQLKGGGWYADGYSGTSSPSSPKKSCSETSCSKDSSSTCPAKSDTTCA